MTNEQVVKRLSRLPAGEYYADTEKLFLATSKSKSEYNVNPITGDKIAKISKVILFDLAFEAIKYGLEAATNGKIRYIGTNDLNTLVVK